uniref:Putative secreted protein n=1 Tax=Ixodes ricinus TaxID=34613 RepID=A0A6B0TZP8_IXORI
MRKRYNTLVLRLFSLMAQTVGDRTRFKNDIAVNCWSSTFHFVFWGSLFLQMRNISEDRINNDFISPTVDREIRGK